MKHPAARRVIGLLVATVAAATLAACGKSGHAAPPGPATTSQAPSTGLAIPDSAFANHKPFTGPAVAKYGQPSLKAAYEESVNFLFETGWSPTLLRMNHSHMSMADFAKVRTFMTPAFRKGFDATLVKVIAGDKAAINKMEQAMSFGISAPGGFILVPGGKIITNRKFTDGVVALDTSKGHDRLSMSFSAKANIELQNAGGVHYSLATQRAAHYWLVPNTGADRVAHPFLIDAWAVRLTAGKPTKSG